MITVDNANDYILRDDFDSKHFISFLEDFENNNSIGIFVNLLDSLLAFSVKNNRREPTEILIKCGGYKRNVSLEATKTLQMGDLRVVNPSIKNLFYEGEYTDNYKVFKD